MTLFSWGPDVCFPLSGCYWPSVQKFGVWAKQIQAGSCPCCSWDPRAQGCDRRDLSAHRKQHLGSSHRWWEDEKLKLGDVSLGLLREWPHCCPSPPPPPPLPHPGSTTGTHWADPGGAACGHSSFVSPKQTEKISGVPRRNFWPIFSSVFSSKKLHLKAKMGWQGNLGWWEWEF